MIFSSGGPGTPSFHILSSGMIVIRICKDICTDVYRCRCEHIAIHISIQDVYIHIFELFYIYIYISISIFF